MNSISFLAWLIYMHMHNTTPRKQILHELLQMDQNVRYLAGSGVPAP